MKTFNISIKIINRGVVQVEANDMDEALKKADDKMYWAYQGGDPSSHKDVSITDCEIEVDGEELDLDEFREAEE